MSPREIRETESRHHAPGVRYFYKGRFLICESCGSRFRMRHNGTLRWIEAGPLKPFVCKGLLD